MTASPIGSGRAVSPYALAILAETLGAPATHDPDSGELRLAVPVPHGFEETSCQVIAKSLARAALYNAGLRGWTVGGVTV